jgi:hypothetical protein
MPDPNDLDIATLNGTVRYFESQRAATPDELSQLAEAARRMYALKHAPKHTPKPATDLRFEAFHAHGIDIYPKSEDEQPAANENVISSWT